MTHLSLEAWVNLVQTIALIVFACVVWIKAWFGTERTAVRVFAAGLFCYFLGDVYWTVHLLLRGSTPAVFSPADIAYFCTMIWISKTAELLTPRIQHRPWWTWALLVIPIGSYIAWVTWYGCEPFGNLLWCATQILLIWRTSNGLAAANHQTRPFFAALMAFVLESQLLQLSWGRAYAFVDLLVTVCMAVMSVMLLKVVAKRDVG